MKMRRMRTIGALADHYRALDPGTAVTACFIRSAALSGAIPCVFAGKKRLIAIEDFDAFLAGVTAPAEAEPEFGTVRPVPLRVVGR